MLFELIAAVVAGVALAGIAMGLRWASRGLLPRWIVPVAAGIGMLSYAVWSEYSWYDRVSAGLPPEMVVAWRNESTAFWRPWSYLKPVVNRIVIVDGRTAQRNENLPDQVMVDVILAARWQPTARVKTVFDCAGNRRADLLGKELSFAENGEIIGASWSTLPADDPVLAAACKAR